MFKTQQKIFGDLSTVLSLFSPLLQIDPHYCGKQTVGYAYKFSQIVGCG